MTVNMSIINMNAFLLIYQGVEFVLVEINLFFFPQLYSNKLNNILRNNCSTDISIRKN